MVPEASPALRQLFAHESRVGYDAQWLSPDEIGSVTPGVNVSAVPADGAVFNPGEGWVDLVPLARHLVQEFVRRGGRVVENAGPATVITTGSHVTAVMLEDGSRIVVDAVLVAAGAAVPRMVQAVGVVLSEQTTNALLLRTTKVTTGLRAVLNTPRVSIRPTSDGALVMDSGWSQRAVVERDGIYEIPDGVIKQLLADASSVLEGTPALSLGRYFVGAKPIPGDGEPVFGALESIDGYYIAFTHSGATLALIAGELLAEEIISDNPHPLLAAFRPSRFT